MVDVAAEECKADDKKLAPRPPLEMEDGQEQQRQEAAQDAADGLEMAAVSMDDLS